MGEAKRRKVDSKYISFKGDGYKWLQWRILRRIAAWRREGKV